MKKIKAIKSGSVVCGLSVKNVEVGREYELTDEEAIAAIAQGFTAENPEVAPVVETDIAQGDEKTEEVDEKTEKKTEKETEKSTSKNKNSKKKKGADDNA